MACLLLYHRITETPTDPWGLNVSPRHFAEHMHVLRDRFEVVRVDDLVEAVASSNVRAQQVAVTFDDGYADNLRQAVPVLEDLGVPATFFLPTGYIGTETEFWWDELDQLLLQPRQLPDHCRLQLGEELVTWQLGASSIYTPTDARSFAKWRAWESAPTARHALYATLWTRCQDSSPALRSLIIQQLRSWAGHDGLARDTHRVLTNDEVVRLATAHCATLGAHTVTHPRLAALSRSKQRTEIEESKGDLERQFGATVSTFAYPFGKRADYSMESLELVRAAGFVGACVNEPGHVTAASGVFELPRLFASDMDGPTFGAWLSSFM